MWKSIFGMDQDGWLKTLKNIIQEEVPLFLWQKRLKQVQLAEYSEQ